MRVFLPDDMLQPIRNAVVTVGSYDGLHYGHRALLEEVKRGAREERGQSVVVTFSPHPRQVLPGGGEVKLLNTLEEKIYLLREAGVDNIAVLQFTPEFASMTSDAFVRDVLVGKIGMKRFVVGYNHRFGSDGGDFGSLLRLAPELGFTARQVSRLEVNERKVSSTVVRYMIEAGRLKEAAELLSRNYLIIADVESGRVIIGDGAKLLPPAGRYRVEVEGVDGAEKGFLIISPSGDAALQDAGSGTIKNAVITFI